MPPLSEPAGRSFGSLLPTRRAGLSWPRPATRRPDRPKARSVAALDLRGPTSAVVVHGFAALPVLASDAGIIYEWLGSFRDEGAGHDLRLFKGIGR